MCRNIKTLYNFKPVATDEEIKNASLQFVRKISGFSKPSKINEESFNIAIDDVAEVIRKLVNSLVTNAEPKNREIEAEKHKIKIEKRFGKNKGMKL